MSLSDCLIHLVELVVFSTTFDEHLERLEAVFKRLQADHLKLKASKCKFFRHEITYLGHAIFEKGIHAEPAKIEAVCNWPQTKSVKEVSMFFCFTGYYRRYVKGMPPLSDL